MRNEEKFEKLVELLDKSKESYIIVVVSGGVAEFNQASEKSSDLIIWDYDNEKEDDNYLPDMVMNHEKYQKIAKELEEFNG